MTNAPGNTANTDANSERDNHRARQRARQRDRMAAHRQRSRTSNVLIAVEVSRANAAALERLGLFDVDGGKPSLAWAVARFLDTAPHIVAVGDALYPEAEGWQA